MRVSELVAALESLVPLATAEDWDNTGLLAGDPNAHVDRALFCIDYTDAVAEDARRAGAGFVLAYHPPIFTGLKRIPFSAPIGRALRDGVALYSPHTALDAASGGTNDVLADACGVGAERAPLRPWRPEQQCKLVTFVPQDAAEQVSRALFAAGAGSIGNYSACSFRSPGTGTFFGEAGAAPVIGQAGQLETVAELRLETVVPLAKLDAVVRALHAAHPYETPAFDLLRLVAPAQRTGQGRIGALSEPTVARALVERVKEKMGVSHALVAGSLDRTIVRAAVAAGAGGELLSDAMQQRADAFVTGELRHHDALRAAARGMTVIALLHSNSERRALDALATRLQPLAPDVRIVRSEADVDPFVVC